MVSAWASSWGLTFHFLVFRISALSSHLIYGVSNIWCTFRFSICDDSLFFIELDFAVLDPNLLY